MFVTIPVPFTTALLGGKVKVPLIDGFEELEIPELTQTGTVFKMKNKGVKYLKKEIYGDLFVTITTEFPKSLDRKTKDNIQQTFKNINDASYLKHKDYLAKLNKL